MSHGILVHTFDTWREGFPGRTVEIRVANTTELAAIYHDVDLTEPADNPQVLDTYVDADGISYGKFERSIYIGVPYQIYVNGETTGIFPAPLSTLDGEDASNALAKPQPSPYSRRIQDILANAIHAADYGQLGSGFNAATNTETINRAAGQAAANAGGEVILPAGTFSISPVTLAAGVVLRGQGRGVTIVQCQSAQTVVAIGGARAGLRDLTLDGVNLVVSSVGVGGSNVTGTVFDRCEIKRFETGMHFKGGTGNRWNDLHVSNCTNGAKLHGDINSGGGSNGGVWQGNVWRGGGVELCSTVGVEFSYEDRRCIDNEVRDVFFDSNTGAACRVNGAWFTRLRGCRWAGNTTDLTVLDDNLSSTTDDAKVVGLLVADGDMNAGTVSMRDTCLDVIFEKMRFVSVTFSLTLLQNNALLLDCQSDSATSITGDTTKLNSFSQVNEGTVVGITTDATPAKAWSSGALDAGQALYLDAIAIGNARNSTAKGIYRKVAKYHRPGFTLAYDGQSANFTLGQVLTGATSGATARIIADADAGATGTLTLRDIVGTFLDNEIITDPLGGSATANGTVATTSVAIRGSVETIGTDFEDVAGWDFSFATATAEIEARVTGAAATTIEWTVYVKAMFD